MKSRFFLKTVEARRPLRGLKILRDVIPGLRSLRSLTRGYYLPSLRDLLTTDLRIEPLLTAHCSLLATQHFSPIGR